MGCSVLPNILIVQFKQAEKVNCNWPGRRKWLLNENLRQSLATMRDAAVQDEFRQDGEDQDGCPQLKMGLQSPKVKSGCLPRSGNGETGVFLWKQLTVLDRNFPRNLGLISFPENWKSWWMLMDLHCSQAFSSFLSSLSSTFHWVPAKGYYKTREITKLGNKCKYRKDILLYHWFERKLEYSLAISTTM